jgi:nucleotide-binding universal stress UspA family protein
MDFYPYTASLLIHPDKRNHNMSYKSILVHVNDSERFAERVSIAVNIAIAHQGHLIGAAMTGVSRYLYQSPSVDTGAPYVANQLKFMSEKASDVLDEFETEMGKYERVSFERRLVEDEVADGLILNARYSDLVVMGQTDSDELSPGGIPDLAAYVMLNSGRPVLIIPKKGEFRKIHDRVLVAWDASTASTRALANAMPLLKRAKKVDIAVFNPASQPGAHGAQAGADIALYLARHDIDVTVTSRNTDEDIGVALLSLGSELGSTSLVMGGYGHTRFREILLGGVTRTVLDSMTLPVLMSH